MCKGMWYSRCCKYCHGIHTELHNCTCKEDGLSEEDLECAVHRTAGGVHPMQCSSCHMAATVIQRRWRQFCDNPSTRIGINRICDRMLQDGLDAHDVETFRQSRLNQLES
jgi:hypothetical protein